MQIHAVGSKVNETLINQLKEAHVAKPKVKPFEDALREFHHASSVAGTVANWLTLTLEQRKSFVKGLILVPQFAGEPNHNPPIAPESDGAFKNRCLERWRALCVIIQEESRADKGVRSPEVAIHALKLLFPEHPWPGTPGK